MSEKENKVQFNLLNVHYALLESGGDTPAWATPVHVPGAVTLTLDPQGDVTPFYADGIVYYQSVANNGYSGDLEMARFPDQMLKEIWGMEEVPEDFVLIENIKAEPKPFALLYQIDGDKDNQYYCLYNCSGTRPAIGGTTNTETKEPETKSSSITAVSLENGNVLARTTANTPNEVRTNWFKKVYEKPVSQSASQSDAQNT